MVGKVGIMPKGKVTFDQIFQKISLQSILGGVAVYVGSKQQGATENQAIVAGVISAITSGLATAHGAEKTTEQKP